MSVFTDLYDAHLTISGHDITWREIIGNGVRSRVGRRRHAPPRVGVAGRHRRQRPAVHGLPVHRDRAATTAGPLYGQAARQVFFIVVSVYGWWRWRQNQRSGVGRTGGRAALGHRPGAAGVRRRRAGRRRGRACCSCSARSAPAGRRRLGTTWADSWIFVGSILATYAMARGWVDFWLCWIAVDLVGVPELLHFHFYPSAVLYGIYGVFVIWGFFTWLRVARTEVEPARRRRPDDRTRCPHERPGRGSARSALDPIERAIADIAAGTAGRRRRRRGPRERGRPRPGGGEGHAGAARLHGPAHVRASCACRWRARELDRLKLPPMTAVNEDRKRHRLLRLGRRPRRHRRPASRRPTGRAPSGCSSTRRPSRTS